MHFEVNHSNCLNSKHKIVNVTERIIRSTNIFKLSLNTLARQSSTGAGAGVGMLFLYIHSKHSQNGLAQIARAEDRYEGHSKNS